MREHRASRVTTTVGKFARPSGLPRAGRPRRRLPMAGHRLRPAFWRIAAAREQRQRDPCEKFGLTFGGAEATLMRGPDKSGRIEDDADS